MTLVEQLYGHHSTATEIVHWLHSVPVQLFSIFLLVLDVLLIIAELAIDMEFPPCHIITRDAISCCKASNNAVDSPYTTCSAGLSAHLDFPATCNNYAHPGVHYAHEALLWTTVGILCCCESCQIGTRVPSIAPALEPNVSRLQLAERRASDSRLVQSSLSSPPSSSSNASYFCATPSTSWTLSLSAAPSSLSCT
jgi:hypothetical protein